MRQAEADISGARDSMNAGHHEWATFQAQQSSEKALKALLYSRGLRAILTHSIKDLIEECKKLFDGFSDLGEQARYLDMFYIPSRYPNGLPGSIAPADFYTKTEAEKCIKSAEQILAKAKSCMGA